MSIEGDVERHQRQEKTRGKASEMPYNAKHQAARPCDYCRKGAQLGDRMLAKKMSLGEGRLCVITDPHICNYLTNHISLYKNVL